jgi:hypothetical protein
MAQLRWRKYPSTDDLLHRSILATEYWSRPPACNFNLKWIFCVLHIALMAVTLDKMHLLGFLSPISLHLRHGLESWRENTPLQEFAC